MKENRCELSTYCTAEWTLLDNCRFFVRTKHGDCLHMDQIHDNVVLCRCEEAQYDAARQICLGLSHLAPPHQGGDK
jgi:hypothetical protein